MKKIAELFLERIVRGYLTEESMRTKYRVIDSIMGSGKTTKIIEELRRADPADDRYIVITPYLPEVERITNAVPELDFTTPSGQNGTKLTDFHRLLETGRNLVSTHALFMRWNSSTLELLREHGYQLIIDETVDCTRAYGAGDGELHPSDVMFSIERGDVVVDNDLRLKWSAERQPERKSVYAQLKRDCDAGRIYYLGSDGDGDGLMFWEFPIELLDAFKSVTILTYLFEGSLMSAYLEGHGVNPEMLTIDASHELVPWSEELEAAAIAPVASLIELVESEKPNAIGRDKYAFCRGWLDGQSEKTLKAISTTTRGILQNHFKANKQTVLWSCVKAYEEKLRPTGFKGGYIACNARATNDYRERSHLAYLRNIYMTPTLWQFYSKLRGVKPDNDAYALAEMLQWVFRSAIRDGKPIKLYLPSSRMRRLLKEWMAAGEVVKDELAA